MTQNMPLTTTVSAIPTPRRGQDSQDIARLIGTWQSIAASAITAEAHHQAGTESLWRQLNLIEAAIKERHPKRWLRLEAQLLQAQVVWEHDAADVSPAVCRVCRRITAGIPLELPLPANGGLL